MLRIWRCNCALCVIGNEFPCRQPHNPIRHPLRRAIHFAQRIKTARRFTAKNPWWQNDFLKRGCISQKRFCMVGTRYFESASNGWYPMWYCDYRRTWNIESTKKLASVLMAVSRKRWSLSTRQPRCRFSLCPSQNVCADTNRNPKAPKNVFLILYTC